MKPADFIVLGILLVLLLRESERKGNKSLKMFFFFLSTENVLFLPDGTYPTPDYRRRVARPESRTASPIQGKNPHLPVGTSLYGSRFLCLRRGFAAQAPIFRYDR